MEPIREMNLSQRNSKVLFLIAFLLSLLSTVYFSHIKLFWFAPFLITTFYQKPLINCFWKAFGCGILMDLTASTDHFGVHAFNYVLVTALLYGKKRHFFGDNLSTLPIMTYLFSVLTTILQSFLLNLLEDTNIISLAWIGRDLLIMPFMDAAYAFVVFVIPWRLLGTKPRTGQDYFSNSTQN